MNWSKNIITGLILLPLLIDGDNSFSGDLELPDAPSPDEMSKRIQPLGEYSKEGYFGYLIYSILQSALIADPEIREPAIVGNLRILRGDEPQVLRLLMWASEKDPRLRRELLVQYLTEEKKLPDKSDFLDWARKILDAFKIKEIETRIKEIDTVYSEIAHVLDKRKNEPRLEIERNFVHPLVRLAKHHASKKLGLFTTNTETRSAILAGLPFPVIDEAGDREAAAIYTMLWLVEVEPSIRMGVILPRLTNCYGRTPRVPFKELERYLNYMKPTSVEVRKAELKRYAAILNELNK